MQLSWLAITFLTSLFAALIGADGTFSDSGPPGNGKATCDDNDDVLKYLKTFS